ncbi:DinB family protein [Nocardia harenae]|uniref:DinB family protein n=1 Tax=Nocardia harenae TaxID=358707 RepID=UPI000829B58A|nr:DinB family protein [Nocardia harenae]
MTTSAAAPAVLDAERQDLLAMLAKARFFLRFTVQNLTDEQAGQRSTASELTLGGLIKHVAATERGWADFLADPSSMKDMDAMTEADFAQRGLDFQLLPGETLAGVLATYQQVADRTDALVATVDLNAALTLPAAPWFQESAWSGRRVLMHIVAETTQHAGHADIIRESLDGQKTMG